MEFLFTPWHTQTLPGNPDGSVDSMIALKPHRLESSILQEHCSNGDPSGPLGPLPGYDLGLKTQSAQEEVLA